MTQPAARMPLPRDPSWRAVIWLSAVVVALPIVVSLIALAGRIWFAASYKSTAADGGDWIWGAALFHLVAPLLLGLLPALALLLNRAKRGPWWVGSLAAVGAFVLITVLQVLPGEGNANEWLASVSVLTAILTFFGGVWMVLLLVLAPFLVAVATRRRRVAAAWPGGPAGSAWPGGPGGPAGPGRPVS